MYRNRGYRNRDSMIVYKCLFLKWGIVMVLDFFMFKFVYN